MMTPKIRLKITYNIRSHVLNETKDKKILLGNEKGFEKEFNYYAELLSNELYNRNLFESLKIINIATKKVVIKEHLHQDQGRPIYRTANQDRKSTRLNSSHVAISYAVFCLKKKNIHVNKEQANI